MAELARFTGSSFSNRDPGDETQHRLGKVDYQYRQLEKADYPALLRDTDDQPDRAGVWVEHLIEIRVDNTSRHTFKRQAQEQAAQVVQDLLAAYDLEWDEITRQRKAA